MASEQQWCWKIHCGTCGHGVFRWGLRALARGTKPGASDWKVKWGRDISFTDLECWNGPMPPFDNWPVSDQRELQRVIAESDLTQIASRCAFPDWLGYLGLALHYIEDAEASEPRVTDALVPQLKKLVGSGSESAHLLTEMMTAKAQSRLTWQSLGPLAEDIARAREGW